MNFRKIVFFLLLSPTFLIAQSEIEVSSKIKEVTIFTLGAEVTRHAEITLKKGVNEYVFTDVSSVLDEQSVQFKAVGSYSILSLKHELRFDENTLAKKERVAAISKELKRLGEEVETRKNALAIAVNEENVVIQNTDYDIWRNMDMAQLKEGVDFVKTRLTEIKARKQKLRSEIDGLYYQKQKLTNELQGLRIAESKPKGTVVIKIKAESTQTLKTTLSYVVADAGWEPFYDLRVEDLSEPLQVDYKAKVRQNTGEEWKQVKLKLSTGNPYEDGSLPELKTWYVNYVSGNYGGRPRAPISPQRTGTTGLIRGNVVNGKTGEAIAFANVVALNDKRELLEGVTSDMDGSFKLNLTTPATYIEASFIGLYKSTLTLQSNERFYNFKLNETPEKLEEVVVAYEPVLKEKSGENISVRGGRAEGTAYFIDGVKVRGSVNIPQASIAQTEVITGGLPAQYGDAMGGVVSSTNRRNYNSTASSEFKISQNPVNLKFEVATLYDIPSDGEVYKVKMSSFEKEVSYTYRATPKLNEHAFLTATMVNWENLNLMNGFAGIYLEGTYLGETYLNVEKATDTLQVDLGKDENIVVLRNPVQLKEASRFLSGKKEEQFHYQIKVRNNKSANLRLIITDQYPVSGNSQISIETPEETTGKLNEKTGIIVWDFTLEPQAEKTMNVRYNIRYPKSRRVNSK